MDILHKLLIRAGTTWWVYQKLGNEHFGRLKAQAGEDDQTFPPAKGWKYNDDGNWHPYPSLECSREPSAPCTEIRVEFEALASIGVCLPVGGEYSWGRQVDLILLQHHKFHSQCQMDHNILFYDNYHHHYNHQHHPHPHDQD